jgi:hypothetical protein
MHCPIVANSLALAYSVIYSRPPTMQTPGREGTYELFHSTYITNYHDWETKLRYYILSLLILDLLI